MLVCSVNINSRLDSQRKFQMFTLFPGRHVGVTRPEEHRLGGSIPVNEAIFENEVRQNL